MRSVLVFILFVVTIPAHAQKLSKTNPDVPPEWSGPLPASPSADLETLRNWWRMFDDSTLTSLVAGAIESNLDLKEAAARVSEVRAARGVAASALQPSIGTSEGYTRVRGGIAQGLARTGISSNSSQSRASLIAPFETNVFQLGFDSFWELDLAGGLRKSVKAADADIRVAEEARNDVRVLVAAEVGRNYVTLRGAQRQLSIVRTNIALQEDSVRLTESRQRAGLAPELDVVRANAQLNQTRSEAPALDAETARAAHALAVLLGRPPADLTQELRLEAALPRVPSFFPAGVPADLLLRRPDLRRESAVIAAAAARAGVARAELYPKLSLSGLVGRQAISLAGFALGIGNFFSVGPLLRLPLFTGGRIRSNVAVEDARLEQATLHYENTVLNALTDVENALSDLSRERERAEQLQAAEVHNRDAVSLTRELYSKGLGDYLAVLDAQRELLAVQRQLAQSETAVLLDWISLYKAMGGGW
jgi:outer membrane protein, multidrug efflux system